ncbi:MAG: arylesterase [Bdellovibrionales bacterium]|jgi:acyl-CoA thioesterase I|nr:arylesterase [Bdellovibrionales bacterium]
MKYLIIFFLILVNSATANTVLFLGDSLTEGYGIKKSNSYPSLLQNKLKKEGYTTLKFINGSISGSTTASGLSRLKWYLKMKPSILVLILGANDGLRGIDPKITYNNLEKVILLAHKTKIKVLLVGLRMPPNYGEGFTDKFQQVFIDLAQKYKLTFVPQILKGVGGEILLNQEDGIHPNEKGHLKMMENVYPKLKELL